MTGFGFHKSLAYLATLGPFGHLSTAPGTIGSIIGVITGYMIAILGAEFLAAATIAITILGTMAADSYSRITHLKDPPEVIIDEVAGQWIPLIILPLDPWWFAAGFILFRFFDISKLGPVGMAERLPGGIGVMADDIVAGVLAALSLFCVALIMDKPTLLNFM